MTKKYRITTIDYEISELEKQRDEARQLARALYANGEHLLDLATDRLIKIQRLEQENAALRRELEARQEKKREN